MSKHEAGIVPEPTPAALREWAEWFHAPPVDERVWLEIDEAMYSAGYLLHMIADAMEGR